MLSLFQGRLTSPATMAWLGDWARVARKSENSPVNAPTNSLLIPAWQAATYIQTQCQRVHSRWKADIQEFQMSLLCAPG